ncbi:hypothetical protein HGM15179_018857 [Zosterops borbonicus]|uniref:Reverse transcriptase thumb domain-containing protein n=1 Tax=Zosterops borbonicus TaxID=364589 RepID=A0A8K1D976_9PASS|nr:hypothetical protein HGM15179_018857 [Zosterops borbonicus]
MTQATGSGVDQAVSASQSMGKEPEWEAQAQSYALQTPEVLAADVGASAEGVEIPEALAEPSGFVRAIKYQGVSMDKVPTPQLGVREIPKREITLMDEGITSQEDVDKQQMQADSRRGEAALALQLQQLIPISEDSKISDAQVSSATDWTEIKKKALKEFNLTGRRSLALPVTYDAQGQNPRWERLDHDVIKELAKAICDNGLGSPYFKQLLKATFNIYDLISFDLKSIASMILTDSQVLTWEAKWRRALEELRNKYRGGPHAGITVVRMAGDPPDDEPGKDRSSILGLIIYPSIIYANCNEESAVLAKPLRPPLVIPENTSIAKAVALPSHAVEQVMPVLRQQDFSLDDAPRFAVSIILQKIQINNLQDLQQLLGEINWMRPILGITNDELTSLFNLLRGDCNIKSPRTLTPEAQKAL